jgi:hypothetical protein
MLADGAIASPAGQGRYPQVMANLIPADQACALSPETMD